MEFIKEMVDNDWLVNVKRFQELHGRPDAKCSPGKVVLGG